MSGFNGSAKMTIDQKPYLLWSPITWDQAKVEGMVEGTLVKLDLKYIAGPYLAEWNLMWLFSWDAMSHVKNTFASHNAMYKVLNSSGAGAAVSVREDVADDFYGVKGMAETLMPTEFISLFMNKPYKGSMIYMLADNYQPHGGDKIFEQARINAPKLEAVMLGEAEIDERGIPIPVPPERRRPRLDRPPERTGNVIQVPFGRK
jgi:hypothetical protein